MKKKDRWTSWFMEGCLLVFHIWLECICVGAINKTEDMVAASVYAVLAIVILLRHIVPRVMKMQRRGANKDF